MNGDEVTATNMETKTTRAPLVRWTKAERAVFLKSLEQAARIHPMNSASQLIHDAQLAMPPDRRRRNLYPSQVFKGPDVNLVAETIQRGIVGARLTSITPPPPVPAPPAPQPPVPAHEPDVATPPGAPEEAPDVGNDEPADDRKTNPRPWYTDRESAAPDATSITTASLIGELVVRLGAMVLSRFDSHVDDIKLCLLDAVAKRIIGPHQAAPVTPTPDATPPAAQRQWHPHVPIESRREHDKPKPPVVTIVGLFKDQFEHVKRKVAELGFDLVFADKEHASPNFGRTDYVVVQRHCSHKWFDAAQAKVGNAHVAFADGGITSTIQRIYDFHARRVSELAKV